MNISSIQFNILQRSNFHGNFNVRKLKQKFNISKKCGFEQARYYICKRLLLNTLASLITKERIVIANETRLLSKIQWKIHYFSFEDLKHYKIVLRNVESFCITLILYDKWKRSKRDMLNIQKGLSVVQYAVCIEWVWNSIFLQQSNLESDFSFGSDFLFKFNSENINFWYSHTMLLQL